MKWIITHKEELNYTGIGSRRRRRTTYLLCIRFSVMVPMQFGLGDGLVEEPESRHSEALSEIC